MIADGYWVNAVPDLASLTPDPEWVLSSIDPSCSVPPSAPVEGRTFTLTISETWGLNAYGYQSNQETSQVHVTLLDGDVYFFTSLCW